MQSSYNLSNLNPIVITDAQVCDQAIRELTRRVRESGFRAIGLDCEWTNSNPVALLQLAAADGYCLLIRLPYLRNNIPSSLQELLADQNILKVGVAIENDARKLLGDYNLRCNGLREFGGAQREGLDALAKRFLNTTLNKEWTVRASNWDAPTLSREQICYAATDAYAAIKIFQKM